MEENIPRRIRLDLMYPAEKIIQNAILEIEKMPASVDLTNAQITLKKAKDMVSDFIDNTGYKMPSPVHPTGVEGKALDDFAEEIALSQMRTRNEYKWEESDYNYFEKYKSLVIAGAKWQSSGEAVEGKIKMALEFMEWAKDSDLFYDWECIQSYKSKP